MLWAITAMKTLTLRSQGDTSSLPPVSSKRDCTSGAPRFWLVPNAASVLSTWAGPGLMDSSRHPGFLCFLSRTGSLGCLQCSHHLLAMSARVFRDNLRPRRQLKMVRAAAESSQRASSREKQTKGFPTQAYVCYLLVWPAPMFAQSFCKLNP